MYTSLFKDKIYRLLASIDGSRKSPSLWWMNSNIVQRGWSLSLSRMNTISVYAAAGLNRRNDDSHISIDSCCVGCRVECQTIFFFISPFGFKLLTGGGKKTNDSAVYNRFPFSFWKRRNPAGVESRLGDFLLKSIEQQTRTSQQLFWIFFFL